MPTPADGESRSFLVLLTGADEGGRGATFRVLAARDHADAKERALASVREATGEAGSPTLEVLQIIELVPLPSYWREEDERPARPAPRRRWWRLWRRRA